MFNFSFVCPLLSPSVQFRRVFFLSFSLSFFPWFDCLPARAFVPSYVSSSDRSFPGAVVRLPSRSIVPSFDLSCDDSFVGPNVRPPVRSYLCLSFRWLFRTGFCLSFLSSVLFFHPLFYFFVLFSFLGSIVRPPVHSFLHTFLRPIDRFLVRSFVCASRSIVPSFDLSCDDSFVGPNVRPPVRSCLCLSFRWFLRTGFCLIFLLSVLFFHLLFYFVGSFFLSFSLSFFPWFDCLPARAFVPSYVSSSDRSFPGAVVRLPSRSIVPSFDLSCDDSFVGPNVRPPVRSYLCLSFLWLFRTGFCLSFLSSVLFFHPLFYFFVLFSFLGSIVRPPVHSFLHTFLRRIDRFLVRSFVCPPVRSFVR